MSLGEVADLSIRDYRVEQALNLDGGGSTTLAMEDPVTQRANDRESIRRIIRPAGRWPASLRGVCAAAITADEDAHLQTKLAASSMLPEPL